MKKVIVELVQVGDLNGTFVSQNQLTIRIGDKVEVAKNRDKGISNYWLLNTMFDSNIVEFFDLTSTNTTNYAVFVTKNGKKFKIPTEINGDALTGLSFETVEKFVKDLKKLKENVENKILELHKVTFNYMFEI